MKREDRKKFNNYSLFTFDEMLNQKLDRWESSALKGTALIYSLVVDMFKYIGDEREAEDILRECKTEERWYDKYEWSEDQHDDWRQTHLIPVLRKRLHFSKAAAERESSWFMLMWSFPIKMREENKD